MQNKFNLMVGILVAIFMIPGIGMAEELDIVDDAVVEDVVSDGGLDAEMEDLSADAVAAYDVNGSLFQQITDLEQEKVLMQLEKERAQLDLDLDRLAAEKIKLHMEIDTLSGRAEQQQQELDAAKAELEAQTAKFEREKEAYESAANSTESASVTHNTTPVTEEVKFSFTDNYRLVNVFGAGNQLQATLEDLSSGQNKRVSVGKTLDGYTVKSISLDEGIVFTDPDGNVQTLNISNNKN